MNAETWVAVVAAMIALGALPFNFRAVRAADRAAHAAEAQTDLQHQLRIDAAQPYVWADVRPDDATGTLLNLTVGNSGPTAATNVRVTVDPPLPVIDQLQGRLDKALTRLSSGLPSLTPGRVLAWPLGQGFNLLNAGHSQKHEFTITAEGPFGPMPPVTYIVQLSDLQGVLDRPTGSLHELSQAVRELGKLMKNRK